MKSSLRIFLIFVYKQKIWLPLILDNVFLSLGSRIRFNKMPNAISSTDRTEQESLQIRLYNDNETMKDHKVEMQKCLPLHAANTQNCLANIYCILANLCHQLLNFFCRLWISNIRKWSTGFEYWYEIWCNSDC